MKENGLKTAIVMVLVLVLGIMLGYYFGKASVNSTNPQPVSVDEKTGAVTTDEATAEVTTETASDLNDGSVAESVPEEGIKVDTATLSDGQKKILNTLGVDTENLVLTPEMVACAEAKIGSARLAEIQAGVSPSFLEGAALVACYK
jgi:hypothetical protein